ncbi:MAG: ABC transporter permease [Chloroflexales bacterium]|nr:ABC transporter permease [Chloroflexales bacterium]
MSPRWRKVLADLTGNKTRTVLVVLSIAIGVFAVGVIAGSREILAKDMASASDATNPFSASITTNEPFDDTLVETVRRMPDIADAEARGQVILQARVGDQEAKNTQFDIIPDFDDLRIGTFSPVAGAWPPPRKALLLERTSLDFLGVAIGDSLTVELPDGTLRTMPVAGTVHDANWASPLFGWGKAYISTDTARWLGQPEGFTQLLITVSEPRNDEARIKQIVSQVRDKIEKGGLTVSFVQVPSPPGKHWADQIMQALLLIMGVLGLVSLVLSGFLVINTLGAILTQQIRQIGIMKSIGGQRGAIVSMYLAMVFGFGVLSLVVAMPLGALGAQLFVGIFAGLLNFNTGGNGIPPYVLGLEVAAGLFVPLLAALWPVLAGTRISIREATSSYGVGKGRFGTSWIDRAMARLRFLSRPMLLSLRNTFRRRGRLALTLSTLTLAGAMVIAVVSVRETLIRTAENFFTTYDYDVFTYLSRPYRVEPLLATARAVPGVVAAEGWNQVGGRRVLADGTKTENIDITALPPDTRLFQPQLTAGRWLLPGDENAIVIAADLLKTEKDLALGDELVLDIDGRESRWRIVGIARVLFVGRAAYASYDYTTRVTGDVGQSSFLSVVTERHDAASQAAVAKTLRAQLKQAGFNISGTQTIGEIRANIDFQFSIVVLMLLMMAVLLAVVGGLGLMGTMSINVIERTREIGVMRAIGASNGAILRIVMVEGVLIGVVSWLVGALIALPFSRVLAEAVGQAFLQAAPDYVFSLAGALLWLATVIGLAALASFLPAWNASRVTVRDVLAYE